MKKVNFVATRVDPAFSTPIYYSAVEGYENDVLDFNNFPEDDFFAVPNNPNTFNSKNANILEDEKYQNIRTIVESGLQQYIYEALKLPKSCTLKLVDSWMVIGVPGSYANTHMHINSMFSGVFYLKSHPGSGTLTLLMPEIHTTWSTPTVKPEPIEPNILNSHQWSIEPQTNDLVIFPSHVYHQVSENITDTLRVAIAFNYFLEGNISNTHSARLSI